MRDIIAAAQAGRGRGKRVDLLVASGTGASVHERRTTLEGLEVGAIAVDRRVDEQVERCLAASSDPVALRQELGGLQGMKSQRAEFAFCLFSLDLARLGEAEARANFARHAGILLEAHRDPDLTRYLLGDNLALAKRWEGFVPLLEEFDKALQAQQAAREKAAITVPPTVDEGLVPGAAAPSPETTQRLDLSELQSILNIPTEEGGPELALDATIERCFGARRDAAGLRAAMEALAALPRTPREEFAHCLFDLELVRLGAEEAKPEFAGRVQYLLEAYRDGERAKELLGESAALKALWDDVRPYLEEFFEPAEEEAVEEIVEEAVVEEAAIEVDAEEVQLADLDAMEVRPAGPPPPPSEALQKPPPRPPPPPSNTPAPGRVRRVSSITAKRLSLPPIPAQQLDLPPSAETLAFWKFIEQKLELLPDENGQLSGKQAFDARPRENRTALKQLSREVIELFPQSSDARALACLTELYLGAQQKEKTLFGKPNEKRAHALQDALSLLASDPVAAGHAAVLFENDGADTIAQFGEVVEVMRRYLAHCLKSGLDPLSPEAVKRFQG